MSEKMRAKMVIDRIVRHDHAVETLHFRAVCASSYPQDGSDENNTYAKFSPSADLELTVSNPDLIGKFNPGESYYLDFTPAPK